MSPPPDLDEALEWLDFCFGETLDAINAVKAAAAPPGSRPPQKYHGICEMASHLTTMRWKFRKLRS